MKLELNKFKLKQVLLSAFVLLISFGAAATATFAWFTVNRNANIGNSNISIDQSIKSYKLMYYEGNYTTEDGKKKYTGYQDYGKISSCKYSDFKEMSDDAPELWRITDMFPDTRYTFAFELTISSGSQISRAGLAITEYTSKNYTATIVEEDRLTMYKVNPNKPEEVLGGIYLSEAINIYAAGMLKEDNEMNTAALNFLHGFELKNESSSLTDVFDESVIKKGDGSDFDGVDLAYVNAPSLSGKTIVVFFTIEFSNASDTYYTYSHRSGNNIYYYKDTVNGSSNCYQLLSFSVTALSLFAN